MKTELHGKTAKKDGNTSQIAAMAVAACIVVLTGWTGAWAQGFAKDHASGDVSGFTGSGGGGWSVQTISEKTGVGVSDAGQQGFFLSDASDYANGVFTVKFNMIGTNTWAYYGAAVVFRYSSSSQFYALRIPYNYTTNYFPPIITKDGLGSAGNIVGANETQLTNAINVSNVSDEIALTISLKDNVFRVWQGTDTTTGRFLGQYIDESETPSSEGKVGYAQNAVGGGGGAPAVFSYSSWVDSDAPKYTLTVNRTPTAGGTVTPSGAQTGTVGGIPTNITATANPGYIFNNWEVRSGTAVIANPNSASTTVTITTNATIRANFVQVYAVTYDENADDAIGTMEDPNSPYKNNAEVTVLANTFIRDGHTFAGWNTTADGSGIDYAEGAKFTMGTAPVTLYAQWEAVSVTKYAVTYNGNATTGVTGTTVDPDSPYETDAEVTVLANSFIRAGYRFTGWNIAATGTGTPYQPDEKFTMGAAAVTLYARWIKQDTLTYSANTGTGTPPPAVIDDNGKVITVAGTTLDKEGHSFDGWNTAADGSGTPYAAGASLTLTATMTLYAQWTETTVTKYAVTYNANATTGVTGTTVDPNSPYETDAEVTVLDNGFIRAGYRFTGWNIAATGTGTPYQPDEKFTMGAAAVTLYARWIKQDTLTYNVNTGTGTPPTRKIADSGTVVTVAGAGTSLAKEGYTFDGWNTAADGGGTAYAVGDPLTLVSDSTLYAQWTETTVPKYAVAYDKNAADATGTTVDPNSPYAAGDEVTVVGNTFLRTGYTFVKWNTVADGTGTDYIAGGTFTMGAAAVTLYAQWIETTVPKYAVAYDKNAADATGTTVDPNSPYAAGDEVTVVGNTFLRTGYDFVKWNTVADGTGTDYIAGGTFTMGAAAVTLYAQWIETTVPKYAVTYNANATTGVTGTTVDPNSPYAAGDEVTVVGNTFLRTGYDFVKWNTVADGTGTDYIAGGTFTMGAAAVTLYAQWSDNVKKPEITIISAVYVDTAMAFNVYYSVDTVPLGGSYYRGCELKLGGVTVKDSWMGTWGGFAGDTVMIPIPVEDIRFDTTYTVVMRMVIGDTSAVPSLSNSVPVTVGAFKVQKVSGVGSTANTAAKHEVSVDNGRFVLGTVGWETSTVKDSVYKIEVEAPATANDTTGFIPVSNEYRYRVNEAVGVLELLEAAKVLFTISVKVDPTKLAGASGYGIENVGLYRYIRGGWYVVRGTSVNTATGYVTGIARDLEDSAAAKDTGVYRLMINRQGPVVTIGGSDKYGDKSSGAEASGRKSGYYGYWAKGALVVPGVDSIVVSNIQIATNVVNTTVEVKYASINDGVNGVNGFDSVRTLSNNGTVVISKNNIYASNQDGILVYLIVDNGNVSDTINMSRQVRLTSYETDTRDYDKNWSPFGARVNLVDQKIDRAFRMELFKDEEESLDSALGTDDTRYRLARWLSDDWKFYSQNDGKSFEVSNGRLMWLRTDRGRGRFKFEGSATSTPLTETFAFADTLKSKKWTDLILPFGFSVRVSDILAASGVENSDSLYFYTWDKDTANGGNYAGKRLYVWNTDNADTVLSGPFTVYNNYTARNIVLRVPPKPAFLSAGLGKAKPLAKTAAAGELWYYAINAATDDAPNLTELRIGYYESERMAPAPPTLSSQSVVILSDDGKWQMGDYMTPELMRGGRTFKIRFVNNDRQRAAFRFSAAASAGVPERMQVMFVDAVTGEVIGGSSGRSITVAGKSHSDVYVVVGSRDYLNKTVIGPTGAKFAMGRIAVNQAARSVRIKYYVPLAGTDRVEVSVYNLKGKLVWKNAEKVRQSSWNTMEWRSRESRGGAVAAGLYIIRVRAVNVKGKTTAVENRRITFSR